MNCARHSWALALLLTPAVLSACGSDESSKASGQAGQSGQDGGTTKPAQGEAGAGGDNNSSGSGGDTSGGASGDAQGGASAGGQAAGSAGASPATPDGKLIGDPCAADEECSTGLLCLREDPDFFGEGQVADGICTLRCEGQPESCPAFQTGTTCVSVEGGPGYCLEACQAGQNVPKCGQNSQRRCLPLDSDNTGACLPSCLDDKACGKDKVCNQLLGLCTDTQPDGKADGETCTAPEDCAGGWCLTLDESDGICSSTCTFFNSSGSTGCHDSANGLGPSLCLPQFDPAVLGDPGVCLPLCETDADCVLESWECSMPEDAADKADFEAAFGAPGLCIPKADPAAGTDAGVPSDTTMTDAGI